MTLSKFESNPAIIVTGNHRVVILIKFQKSGDIEEMAYHDTIDPYSNENYVASCHLQEDSILGNVEESEVETKGHPTAQGLSLTAMFKNGLLYLISFQQPLNVSRHLQVIDFVKMRTCI